MSIKKERVGLLVTGALALFGIGMFLIGDRHQLFARHTEYYTEFTNLSGLTTGAKVRVSGLDAGEVLAIGVPDSPAARFRLRFRIDAKLRALVRSDSVDHDCQGRGRRRHLPVGATGQQPGAAGGGTGDDTECGADGIVGPPHQRSGTSR